MNQPEVHIGILTAREVEFCFHGNYSCEGINVIGDQKVEWVAGKIQWNGKLYTELLFEPELGYFTFELYDVVIGVGFHWERNEDQLFEGKLHFVSHADGVIAINILPVESYLKSVISSEMSAHASLEFLKAHAVISRSWLLAQLEKRHHPSVAPAFVENDCEHIRWYDREDHECFDVCADDHCQRYQGVTKVSTSTVCQAVEETWGMVLTYGGDLCDARFSKCCGGALEEFQSCWEDVPHPYLTKRRDSATPVALPDLTDEEQAEAWIRSCPEAFCHTEDVFVLQQVLNGYDRETPDFYRWKVSYTVDELSKLVAERSGIDFGEIKALIPVERGVSGRLVRLRIEGSKCTKIIGKELEIRRILSTSHLYSSAFVVDKIDNRFVLTGAGWGHGVGLCQIGAAVMATKGYTYDQILLHYYNGAKIEQRYE